MGIPQFRREGWLGFYLTLILALSLCHGKHVQVKIVGSTECARWTSDIVKTWHPTSSAISRMSDECSPVESSSLRQSKNGNIERLPPTFTEYIKPLQPTPQLKQNLARPPVSVSRKLLTHPIQIFLPIIPPLVPAIHYPFPALAPLVGIPFPTPAPTYQKPLPPSANSPEPIIQKPYPPLAPTYQKPLPPSANSPMPIIHKPYPPPAPKFKKSSPPPLPVEKPNDPANPPIFISPASLPQPNPSHEQAPSPLSNVRPSPSSATPSNSFSPFPRAPPIPALPPIPTVPRRYFNLPKSGHKSPTPPTKSHS